jgi:type I restriction enzyme M protein
MRGEVKANVLFFDRMPGCEEPWTMDLCVYALRSNSHFTLNKYPLGRHHLNDLAELHNPPLTAMYARRTGVRRTNFEGRWRCYSYGEIMRHQGANLDLSCIRNKSLEDSATLEDPEVFAREAIANDLEGRLGTFCCHCCGPEGARRDTSMIGYGFARRGCQGAA